MVFKYIWAFLQGLIFLYLQILLMPAFTIAGAIPNILLPWMIYSIWAKPLNVAAVTGFLIALMYDATLPASFGMHAVIFLILCVVVDLFRKPFEAESLVAKLLTLFTGNVVFSLINHLVFGLSYGFDGKLFNLILISFCYNLVVSFIVFWVMKFLSQLRLVIEHD
ncbi:MAG TPA: rod shape-determining protein MreD [Candidatus Cloacimonadota bacterium]|nr:rod shape-determining protein MreD [Candidatus Cloacimonadota bacterium]HPS39735.1 rod shape-determining protein MreD [Candidatus Cloacimonadota bacterium]